MTITDNVQSWNKYLQNISWKHANVVRQFWTKLITELPNICPPQSGLSPDQESFFFVWDDGNFYLDIELFPDSKIEWFYRDRVADLYEGTEDPVTDLDNQLLDYLSWYAICKV